jgi:hypothetical protein
MALIPLRECKDGNRQGMVGIVGQGYVMANVLAATVAEVVTVPTGATKVIFSATGNFFANLGGVGAIPATEVTNGSGSLLNPELRELDGAATIGLIAPADCTVVMEFFK